MTLDHDKWTAEIHQALSSSSYKGRMSCCGGNCGCGSACKCGSGCGGCKMYPDLSSAETITTETLVLGVAPEKNHFEGASEMVMGAENGCKCGANCTCDPLHLQMRSIRWLR
ncbi:hypothetical protein OIU84_011235 [Salix udensis]|uniref:Metallothionein-like protein n=2 Tax=Salix udensis TaxID=889485 RepID=A0AAD6JMG6_9ROSI|nr:hypothetical protein OIU84_011235 [Salix udensis]